MVSEPHFAKYILECNVLNQSPIFVLSDISNLRAVQIDHSNYILWWHQMISILEAFSLLGFVDGSFECPYQYLQDNRGEENPAYLQWIAKDRALLIAIYSTLSYSALTWVVGKNTAWGAWETLQKVFDVSSRSHILNLKGKLYNMKENDSITAYFQQI